MAVTINQIGPNSRQIVVQGERGPENIINAVETCLVNSGWSLYDTVESGSKKTNVTKVYSAPNADDPVSPTSKYMIIRWQATKGRWFISCCEAWNTTTHVATNESFQYYRNFALPLQNSYLIIYVFSSARYAVFQPALRGELGVWQGVFEFERGEMPEDTAANQALGLSGTCFGYTNGRVFGHIWSSSSTTSQTGVQKRFTMFAVPRTINGFTGLGAARQFTLRTGLGDFPPNHNTIANGASLVTNSTDFRDMGISQAFFQTQYNNNRETRLVLTPKLGAYTNQYIAAGRIYGINIVPPIADQLDTVTIPVDANGFYSSAGSNTSHYVFGLTGGAIGNAKQEFGRQYWQPIKSASESGANTEVINPTYVFNGIVTNGRYIWVSTYASGTVVAQNTIWYYDMDLQNWSSLNNIGYGESGSGGMAYDGRDFIYISGTRGVARINVNNISSSQTEVWASANGVSGGGWGPMEIDENYLYVGQRATSQGVFQPKIDILNQNTTNISAGTITLAREYLLPNTTQSSQIGAITKIDDEQANVIIFTSTRTTGPWNKLVKIASQDANWNANSYVVYNVSPSTSGGSAYIAGGFWFYDGEHLQLRPTKSASGTGLSVRWQKINSSTGSTIPGTDDQEDNNVNQTFSVPAGFLHEPVPWLGLRLGNPLPFGWRQAVSALTNGANFQPAVISNWTDIGTTDAVSTCPKFNAISGAIIFNQAGNATYTSGFIFTDYIRVYRMTTIGQSIGSGVSATGGFIYGGQMQVRNYTGNTMSHVLIRA